ncbi:MAG: sigma-70 family RNA polymerase sigma factor [Prevotella sp.]|jgi:RNA polymerase primary sigma factor
MNNDEQLLQRYFAEIGKEHLLSQEEESRLSRLALQGNQDAANKLVSANLRFVVAIAKQYKGRGLPLDDLVAEGNVGLVQAVSNFDASRGKRFVTYAAPIIRASIEKALDAQNGIFKVPRKEKTPSSDKRRKALSVDAPVGGSPELSLLHVLANPNSPQADERVTREIMQNDLQRALDVLPSREREVVEYFYGIGRPNLTFAEIGEIMGLKRERVRQIRKRAVRRMYQEGRLGSSMKEYLRKEE